MILTVQVWRVREKLIQMNLSPRTVVFDFTPDTDINKKTSLGLVLYWNNIFKISHFWRWGEGYFYTPNQ